MPERDEFSDYLALERTFLAWVRTGLALMGFGFVVARFGLFLRELQTLPQAASNVSTGLSVWFGTALILLGVVVNVLAAFRHRQLIQKLDRGDVRPVRSLWSNAAIALLLALIGVAMAVYLMSVRSASPSQETAPIGFRSERFGPTAEGRPPAVGSAGPARRYILPPQPIPSTSAL